MAKKKTLETTITETVTTESTYAPTDYYPIKDEASRLFFESKGATIVTIERYGQKKLFALIPEESEDKAKTISRKLDSMRRKADRHKATQKKHEFSFDGLLDSGYDPTLDVISTPLPIPSTNEDEYFDNTDESEFVETAASDRAESEFVETTPIDGDYVSKEAKAFYNKREKYQRGGYDSSLDTNNPEYIFCKKLLYDKLDSLVSELSASEKELVEMIKNGQSERDKAKELGIPQTTLNSRKKVLLAKLHKELKDYR